MASKVDDHGLGILLSLGRTGIDAHGTTTRLNVAQRLGSE